MDPLPDRSERVTSLESRASANLRFIRSTIERAGAFTSVPGKGGIAMGIVALVAAVLASQPGLREHWLTIWIVAAAIAAAIGWVAVVRKARSSGQPLLGPVGRRFLLGLTPPIVTAVVLTPFLIETGSQHLIAASWLLLYGAGVMAGGAFSIRLVPMLGGIFMLLGLLCLLITAAPANVYMAAGFGIVHILFGALIARDHGG